MGKRKKEEMKRLTDQVQSLQEAMKKLVEQSTGKNVEVRSKKRRVAESDEESQSNSQAEYDASGSEAEDGSVYSQSSHNTEVNQNKENDANAAKQIEKIIADEQKNSEIDKSTEINEAPIDDEIAEALGENPLTSKALDIKLHSQITDRWKYWYSNGLKKEEKEKLLEKYANPAGLEAPKLNPEIMLKLPKHSKSRDFHMVKRQELAGAALSSIGLAMNYLIEDNTVEKVKLIERLSDASKLLVEMMHSQTKSRIAFIVAGVDKETKSILEDTKPEEFIFGKNLSEKFKEAKSIDKVASSIKKFPLKSQNMNTSYKQNLNYQSLRGKRPFLNQAGPSYQGYQYPSGQTRGRFFRTKQPFNNRAQYQGQNRSRNQTRFK